MMSTAPATLPTSTPAKEATGGITHTMETNSYSQTSIHQYDAHRGCQHMLEGILERFAKRIAFEDNQGEEQRQRHVVDLGSADGANSMLTLQWTIDTLKNQLQQQQPSSTLPPIKVTMEEHPASDEEFLTRTIHNHQEWFQSNGIQPSVLMKSFYEPLFPPASIDMLMCYICLHWLDSTDTSTNQQNSMSEWKSWAEANTGQDFVFMNETTAPKIARELWQKELGQRHLAKFLALRAQELRPGAEGILVMVGAPNHFACPNGPEDETQAAPLTLAMQACVKNGLLREQVLQQTLVPYYNRTEQDIRDAMELAATIAIPKPDSSSEDVEYPGSLLSLVDVLAYPVYLGKEQTTDDAGAFRGAFDMLWSIHQGAIRGAGATDDELEAIRKETWQWFQKLYDPAEGVRIMYLACVIRRRTRKAWS